jgi:hypothetical protein
MVALVAVLGWESLPAPGDPPGVAPSLMPRAGTAPPAAPPPIATWTNVVLERPLFARDRRPKRGVTSAASRSGESEALPRLAGTVRSNDTMMAIFVPAGPTATGATATSPSANIAVAANAPSGAPTRGDPPANGTHPDWREKPVVVGRDGIVAGWTVLDIRDGAVTLERNGRSVTLRLSYANRPVAAQIASPEALVLLHDKRTSPFLQP